MDRLTITFLACVGLVCVQAIPICTLVDPQDCQKCDWTQNPLGYLDDPCSDCGFLQCWKNAFGGWQVTAMDCDNCTCYDPSLYGCNHDPSKVGNDCESEELLVSIVEDTCHQGSGGVDLKVHPSDPSKFYYVLPGGVLVEMDCAPGTVFELVWCTCIFGDTTITKKPAFCLTCDNPNDLGATTGGVWTQPIDVTPAPGIVNDGCGFNGNSSHIEIPYFTNNEFSHFSLNLWYFNMGSSLTSFGLASNENCMDLSSIYIGGVVSDQVDDIVNCGIVTGDTSTMSFGLTAFPVKYAEWIMVSLIYDGYTVTVYIDGQAQSSVAASGKTHRNSCPFNVGSKYESDFFQGHMDEVCFYNYALTAEEVQTMFNDIVLGKK